MRVFFIPVPKQARKTHPSQRRQEETRARSR